jgi:hypothetical protein
MVCDGSGEQCGEDVEILASSQGLHDLDFAVAGSAGAHELRSGPRVCRNSEINGKKGGSTMQGENDIAETALRVVERTAAR